MPQWLADVTLAQLVAVGGVVLLVAAFLGRVIPVARKISRLADAFLGVPESHPGAGDDRPGVLDRLTGVERGVAALRVDVADARRVARIAAEHSATAARELLPNGGGSARDAIDDIRAKIDQTQE